VGKTTIDTLLARREARRINAPGKVALARQRLPHSRFLAEHFTAYDALRHHLFNPDNHPMVVAPRQARPVIDYLTALGWINTDGAMVWRLAAIEGLRIYLSGGWLEELVYCAHEAAGVDEAYFSQEIEWNVNGIVGKNEIDVLARRGDVLSFTSCKTLRAYRKGIGYVDQLRTFLAEADYWNIHFAEDKGRALLIVTADFLDELHNDAPRYPLLLARASVLDVSVAGLEMLSWDSLIEAVRSHWKKTAGDI